MNRHLLQLCVVLSLLAPSFAAAQQPQLPRQSITRYEVTLLGGYRNGGSLQGFEISPLKSFSASVKASTSLAFAIDVPVSADYQLELWGSRQNGDVETGIPLDGSHTGAELKVSYLQLGLVKNWYRSDSVAYYLAVATGLAQLRLQALTSHSESRLSASLAGGVKVFFSDYAAIRLDLRGYWTGTDTRSTTLAPGALIYFRKNLLQAEASVGVSFVW
ncbi:MAG: hypothetical protein LJE95_00920 [Acidobacteria bacterium]|nr:hypothetical protein [Acidobacteriota bacterium]